MSRNFAFIVAAVAIVVVASAVLMVFVSGNERANEAQTEKTAAESPSDEKPAASLTPEQGGPYLPYPLSFPKVLAGLLYFEESRPAMAPTRAQCAEFLPALDSLASTWPEVLKLTKRLHRILTPMQERYIVENKSELEKTSAHLKASAILKERLGARPSGSVMDSEHFAAMAEFCRQRAVEKKEDLSKGGATGRALITHCDIATGLLLMEAMPALQMSSSQAREMAPLFDRLARLSGAVDGAFQKIRSVLTKEQIEAVKEDIEKITKVKFSVFDRGADVEDEDPLIGHVIQMCRSKAKEAEAASK